MKIKINLFAFFLLTMLSYSPVKAQTEELKIGNYTLKNMLNADKTYGFEIYIENQKKPLLQQKIKPYSTAKAGFIERQNAVVAAMWYINELKEGRNDIKKLTLVKAKQLGITQNDLNQ
ncbi:MAG: hypothetical protein H7Z13_04265 [Ferruginibacter sp.]|nr:hypothetical protein [Ferruginibacter sp.]